VQDPETGFAHLVQLSRQRRAWIDGHPPGRPIPDGGPPAPDAQRDALFRLGAAIVPVAAAALSGADDVAALEALLLLERLGPAAVAAKAAVTACLTGPVEGRRTAALAALVAIDLDAVFASGAHLDPTVMASVDPSALAAYPSGARALLSAILDDGPEPGVLAALDGRGLSVSRLIAAGRDNLIPIAALRRRLGDARPAVRRKAAVLLSRLGAPIDVPAATAELAQAESLDGDLVSRLAPYPGSEALVPVLARSGKATPELRLLVARRRTAGLPTDPGPLRELVRAGLSEQVPPGGLAPAERARLSAAIQLAGWLDDDQLLDDLVGLWRRCPELDGDCRLALSAFGMRTRDLLAASPTSGDQRPHDPHAGDDRLIAGRIDERQTGVASACDLYEQAFLADPGSAHAAFMMAWIDRAFGVAIRPERIAWLRELGIADGALLAELAAAPRQVLRGPRRQWSAKFPQADDRASAGRAGEAGLPGLAAAFHDRLGETETAEQLRQLERERVDRVRSSGPPPGIGAIDPTIAAAAAAAGSWCWVESPEGWLLGFLSLDGHGPFVRAGRVSAQPAPPELDTIVHQPPYAVRVGAARWSLLPDEQRLGYGLPGVPPWAWRERPWLHDPVLRSARLPASPDYVRVLFVGSERLVREWLWVRLDGVDPSCAGYTGVVVESADLIDVPPRISVRCPPRLATPIWVSDVALGNLKRRDCLCDRCGCDVYPRANLPIDGVLDLVCPACQGAMRSTPWPPPDLPRPTSASAICRRCSGPIGVMARRAQDRTMCPACGDLVTVEAR
jgi:hypothetical protein